MSGKGTTAGEIGERGLIRHLRSRFPGMSLVGDDAAWLPPLACPVVTTDSFLEGRHFFRWWCDPGVLGRRLLEATLSDLAAMGACPGWVFSALGLPGDMPVSWLEGFYGGLTGRRDCPVAGGEIVRSEVFSVTLTAVGEGRDPSLLLRRSGLRPGDALWVSGRIGRALDAPSLLERSKGLHGPRMDPSEGGLDGGQIEQVRAFLAPRAEFGKAALLVGAGVGAGIDVSDGLLSEAGHLAVESGVDTFVDLDSVPFFGSVEDRALEAAAAGEDFVLLAGAQADMDLAGAGFVRVGRAGRGSGLLHVMREGSEIDPGGAAGYDHFG